MKNCAYKFQEAGRHFFKCVFAVRVCVRYEDINKFMVSIWFVASQLTHIVHVTIINDCFIESNTWLPFSDVVIWLKFFWFFLLTSRNHHENRLTIFFYRKSAYDLIFWHFPIIQNLIILWPHPIIDCKDSFFNKYI